MSTASRLSLSATAPTVPDPANKIEAHTAFWATNFNTGFNKSGGESGEVRFFHFFVGVDSPHVTLPPPAIIRECVASVIAHCPHWIFSAEGSWFSAAPHRVGGGFHDGLIIESTVLRHGYKVIVCNTDESIEMELIRARALVEHRVDGIIVSPTANEKGEVSRATKEIYGKQVHTVIFDRAVKGLKLPTVVSDNVADC